MPEIDVQTAITGMMYNKFSELSKSVAVNKQIGTRGLKRSNETTDIGIKMIMLWKLQSAYRI
jgi:hypothetical protein